MVILQFDNAMNPAIHKTLALLLLIVVGLLLKTKIRGKENLGGIKTLILSLALPATIFVALLKINIEPSLLFLPILALAFNLIMIAATRFVFVPVFGLEAKSSSTRTLMMLMPSLAPGLSCFPFIIEYLGDESLARAALADVGNKVFGLILLYMLAMRWFYRLNQDEEGERRGMGTKIKSLVLSLIKEPINVVIVVAILLLALGINLQSLPVFLQDSILRMSALTTALVLLFIGLAVKLNWGELRLIFNLLLWRAGIALCLSAVLLSLVPAAPPAILLVAVVFPLSSCSFWPFAHMSAVEGMEDKRAKEHLPVRKTFDIDLALNVLACSLPFSTVLIMTICAVGDYFVDPTHLFRLGGAFLLLAGVPQYVLRRIKDNRAEALQLAEVGEE